MSAAELDLNPSLLPPQLSAQLPAASHKECRGEPRCVWATIARKHPMVCIINVTMRSYGLLNVRFVLGIVLSSFVICIYSSKQP